jgi:tRNA threonylcarbamoyl adenosine modification protein YeaZ
MQRQYIGPSSYTPDMRRAAADPLLLALDTGSPLVSVALGAGGRVVAARAAAMERSSSQLLALVAEVLAAGGARPADLGGLVALAGPGSFTGLRIGLATALGWHQALGLPALALPTLWALAAQVPPAEPPAGSGGGIVVAAVDALRGQWSAQRFSRAAPPEPSGGMELVDAAALIGPLAAHGGGVVIGFGVTRLAAGEGEEEADGRHLREPGALAPTALRLAAAIPLVQWDPAALASPIYARPPAVTLPRRRGGAEGSGPGAPAAGGGGDAGTAGSGGTGGASGAGARS